MGFQYRTKTERVDLGAVALDVECLESLDATIDDLFQEYERTGREDLFEEMCPYFGNIWPAGVALARKGLDRSGDWKGSRVLEIGCGLALPSLALGKLGCSVTASDVHPDVPEFFRRNTARNTVSSVEFILADWKVSGVLSGPWDVILASDVLYDRRQMTELADFLHERMGREAILADPGRPYWDSFLKIVRERGIQVTESLENSIFFAHLRRP